MICGVPSVEKTIRGIVFRGARGDGTVILLFVFNFVLQMICLHTLMK